MHLKTKQAKQPNGTRQSIGEVVIRLFQGNCDKNKYNAVLRLDNVVVGVRNSRRDSRALAALMTVLGTLAEKVGQLKICE